MGLLIFAYLAATLRDMCSNSSGETSLARKPLVTFLCMLYDATRSVDLNPGCVLCVLVSSVIVGVPSASTVDIVTGCGPTDPASVPVPTDIKSMKSMFDLASVVRLVCVNDFPLV